MNSVMAFTYQMEVMITPFNSFAHLTVNSQPGHPIAIRHRPGHLTECGSVPNALPQSPSNQPYPWAILWLRRAALSYNLFDVRLRFSWPVLPNGGVGPGRQTYRTLIASPLLQVSEVGVSTFSSRTMRRRAGILGGFSNRKVFANSPPPGLVKTPAHQQPSPSPPRRMGGLDHFGDARFHRHALVHCRWA
jgi:hypothetical protein